MTQEKSYRQILRSTSIIGGASIVNVLIGLLRMKVVAVLLGPSGVGLIGLYNNIMSTATTVAGLGLGNVGIRQIAEASGRSDHAVIARARCALFWGTLFLAFVGGAVVWLLRNEIARAVFGHVDQSGRIGWLALGVMLSIGGASQGALLNGLRRINDLAQISVLSALFSTLIGISVLAIWGAQALLVFVLVTPAVNFLLGHYFVASLPRVAILATPIQDLLKECWALARLGFSFMATALVTTLMLLVVRTLVQRQLGLAELGYFQAAWTISMIYVGFVLQAMGSDFYPRLTAVIRDHHQANRLVNEQTEIALLLAAPILIAMLAFVPWVVHLLYAESFATAVEILRWQVVGDVFKLASWPLGFLFLASGNGRTFFITEAGALTLFAAFTWFGLPRFGIQATGIAFLMMYLFYLPLVHWLAWRKTRFSWTPTVKRLLGALVGASILMCGLSWMWPLVAAVVGGVLMFIFGLHTLTRLAQLLEMRGRLGRLSGWVESLLKKIGVAHG